MHIVTYTAQFTGKTFPSGTTLSATTASLVGPSGPVSAPVTLDANGVAVFTSVPDGTYTMTVQAFDGASAPLGAPYIVQVVVSDPDVTINLPTGGTVVIS